MTSQSHKRGFNSTHPIAYGRFQMSSSGQYHELKQTLAGEHATTALGAGLAPILRPGDLVCLNGGLGADINLHSGTAKALPRWTRTIGRQINGWAIDELSSPVS